MTIHKYILEPYNGPSTRHQCPSCLSNQKTLSLYIDSETGDYLNSNVGRCNRESNCGYHYTPKEYFNDNNIKFDSTSFKKNILQNTIPKKKIFSFVPFELFEASLQRYERNQFIDYLLKLFGVDILNSLIEKYYIGTSKHWEGSTIFWQIDLEDRIRTGKIMLYSPITGKRVKEPINHIAWVHKCIKQPDFGLNQCFFGEHLLKDNTKPVAIVESEKTAIIASVYLNQFIWLASGSLNNLNAEKCKALKGRKVFLFPDLNAFDKWTTKANELSSVTSFYISDLLEKNATEIERRQGYDLADYLTKYDYRSFVGPMDAPPPTKQTINDETEIENDNLIENTPIRENWEEQINELEAFFKSINQIGNHIRLNQCTTISDTKLFIQSHLANVKANNGNKTFIPYLDRLKELKHHLNINTNQYAS